MLVDKFGRNETMVQETLSFDVHVPITQMNNYFLRRDGSNTT